MRNSITTFRRDLSRRAIDGPTVSAVSLHGHTLHSHEGMQFIPRIVRSIPPLRHAIDAAARKRGCAGMDEVDWSCVYWTPPLTPRQALELEETQIRSLGLRPLVSLTDHDDISAPVHLNALPQWCGAMPISVEWTVPFGDTFFHAGIHNLPGGDVQQLWSGMAAAAGSRDQARIGRILAGLRDLPGTLVVVNHPCWDEKGVGGARHRQALREMLTAFAGSIDALEWNGFRPHAENLETVEWATHFDLPVVSGGDRHGLEPNACLNLTAEQTFQDFADEIRNERVSRVLLQPQYFQPRTLRVIHHMWEILRDDPDHGLGWTRWNQRIFYRDNKGAIRPLAECWGGRAPFILSAFVWMVQLMGHAPVRNAVRTALSIGQESGS
ncbi:MAG: hypothetical protein R2729_09565 [Bryobacteraceae bacterium]